MATNLQSILYSDEDGNTINPIEFINTDESLESAESDWFNDSGEINIEEILGGSLFENLLNEIRGGGDELNDNESFIDSSSESQTSDSDSDGEDGVNDSDGENGEDGENDKDGENGENNEDGKDSEDGKNDDENDEDNKTLENSFFNDDFVIGGEPPDIVIGEEFTTLAQSIASKYLN